MHTSHFALVHALHFALDFALHFAYCILHKLGILSFSYAVGVAGVDEVDELLVPLMHFTFVSALECSDA